MENVLVWNGRVAAAAPTKSEASGAPRPAVKKTAGSGGDRAHQAALCSQCDPRSRGKDSADARCPRERYARTLTALDEAT